MTCGGYVTTLRINYSMDMTEYKEIQTLVNEAVDEALSYVSDDMQEYEKALVIHDWLIDHCQYDYGNLQTNTIPESSYNLYGALAYGLAVCDGYSKAYQYILEEKLGIECCRIVSDSMNHAWNLIKIGNNYYHVDVTWDDPICVHRARNLYVSNCVERPTCGATKHIYYACISRNATLYKTEPTVCYTI